jgi:hypothetical protein
MLAVRTRQLRTAFSFPIVSWSAGAYGFSFGSKEAAGLSWAPRGCSRSAGVGLRTRANAMPGG